MFLPTFQPYLSEINLFIVLFNLKNHRLNRLLMQISWFFSLDLQKQAQFERKWYLFCHILLSLNKKSLLSNIYSQNTVRIHAVKYTKKPIQILSSKRKIMYLAKNAGWSISPYFEIKHILSNKTHLLSLSCYFYYFIESLSLLPVHFSLIYSLQAALRYNCWNEGQLLQQIYFL